MAAEAAPAPVRQRVLFVCVGNSCRSQFAEAIARKRAADAIEASSAGLSPLGHIAEPTRLVAAERGWALDGQYSKGFSEADLAAVDLVVSMSGIPARSLFPANTRAVDWDIDDPYTEDLSVYRRVAEEIEDRVLALAGEIRAAQPAGG